MPTTRAGGKFGSGRTGINRVATNTMKGSSATLALEAKVIAVVIVIPHTEKNRSDQHAVKDDGSGEFEHRSGDADRWRHDFHADRFNKVHGVAMPAVADE
jgi:hypothetical protein